jgi:hypothetical protein
MGLAAASARLHPGLGDGRSTAVRSIMRTQTQSCNHSEKNHSPIKNPTTAFLRVACNITG